jgi:hypothetical protein
MFLQGSPVFHLQDSATNTGLYCRWLLDGSTLGMPLGDALGILLGAADGLLEENADVEACRSVCIICPFAMTASMSLDSLA